VGIGKTRLAEELLSWVNRQGLATAIARCYAAAGGLAYAPVAAWLRADALQTSLSTLPTTWLTEVARLVPDLLVQRPDLPHPGPLVEGWQRQHLFEALARATLASRQPLLLLLDDLQWCDQETLEWLHYLLRFDPQAPLLLVGTLRSEEMTNEHLLASFLVSLRHEGVVVEIELGPLDVLDTSSLATQVAGRQLDPTMAVNLYHETEGNPLFVVETVRAGTLEAQGAEGHTIEDKTNHSMLPPTVQAVIAARLAQLSPAAREVTSVAAVIGRAFTFAVLARASGREEDALVEELDELWQKRIIRQQGAGTSDAYDFSHDKLREGAYMALSSARRRLLHRRAAEALEALHASNLDTVSGQLAAHYEHAGLLQQAISYYRRAGEVARQVYANTEALTYFQRALALLERIVPGASQQQWLREMTAQFHEQVGDTFELTGQYEEMRKAYQHALNHVPTHKQIWQARLHRKVAKSWETYRRYEEALRAYRMAESTLD